VTALNAERKEIKLTIRRAKPLRALIGHAGTQLHCHKSSYFTFSANDSKAKVTAIRILIPKDYSVF
jgi:hypothetical protein